MKTLSMILFCLLVILSCKEKPKSTDSTIKVSSENSIKENELVNDVVDYYSELSYEETKLLDAIYKVKCIKNTNYKSYPTLIGLNPISEFYIDLFNSKELARISVGAYKKNDINSVYYLKYTMLTGITRYNQQLNWNEISRDSIIAKVEVVNQDELKFWWYGFYDNKQQKRVHLVSDFNTIGGENPVTLIKCDYE